MAARCAFVLTLFCWTSFLDAVPLDGVSLDACRCLTVHFLDVGQGDAAALRTPGGRWVVVDGGPRTPESDAGRRVVIPFLRRRGASRLALVVATHGDADHLGGLPAVVRTFRPDVVLEPGEPLGRPLYLEFLGEVEAAGSRYHPARAGDRIELDGVTLEVLSPDAALLALPLDVNEHGVVLRVTYGAVRLLLQADAGLPVEARLAGRGGTGELSNLLYALCPAAKIISRHVRRAGLTDILGTAGAVNVSGDLQQKLDLFANETVRHSIQHTGRVCVTASEEDEEPVPVPPGKPAGKYVVLYDPLDGSANIDVNVSIGTIFSIHRRVTRKNGPAGVADCLPAGKKPIAPGYILYGSSTMLVYTTGQGVHGFTLDPTVGEFPPAHPAITTPAVGEYS